MGLKVKEISTGFIACLSLGLISQAIGNFFPQVGASLFAILLGIICGNTILNQSHLSKGVRFSESRLLEISIALTGLTLNMKDVLAVGWQGLGFIILQMIGTVVLAYHLGSWLGFSKKFSLLMSAGNAVCGSSAIGTISPVVEADDKDKGISITIVNLTGTILMVALPLVTGYLYQHQVIPTSAMIGGVLQSVGQVIASAKLVNEDVTQYATIFKIIRIIFLVVVAIVFSKFNTREGEPLLRRSRKQEQVKRVGIPRFILAFFACCLAVTLNLIPDELSSIAKKTSNQFEIIALAGIGMRVKFRDLIKEGPKAMLYGGSIGIGQVLLAIILIFVLFRS
ncbi:YeiH family protein [Vagococcus intermedius]|uniref:Sulfate exporter family transporter n=1 Tax=Vagococcus intermedius TaxID=2991418 RepID=A0AAF0I7Y6_9ENTE|nr:putative sulfate exporter family transporter [Vagococcus intermedius]WEG73694.1 putative sulfate exporter family transporter [Vagococcus intermedius]WEG75778.1 putative sulfate exporter family transporter [Vagococcus intermedius]